MTEPANGAVKPEPAERAAKLAPETLDLRVPPPRVRRISRTILIGTTGLGLFGLAGIVLFALRPPSLQIAAPPELINTGHKIISDGLSRLPATYDGVRTLPPQSVPKPATPFQPPPAGGAQQAQTEAVARAARRVTEANEAPVLFRLQPVASPAPLPETAPGVPPAAHSAAVADAAAALSALKTAAGDTAQPDGSDQMRKLAFLKAGPDSEIYNPHALQTPVLPYHTSPRKF